MGTDRFLFLRLGLLGRARHGLVVGSSVTCIGGLLVGVQLEIEADLMLLVLVGYGHLELRPRILWASLIHLISKLRRSHNELELGSRLVNAIGLHLLLSSTAHHAHDGLGERTVTRGLRNRLVLLKIILLLEFTFLSEFWLFWLVFGFMALAARWEFLAFLLIGVYFSIHFLCHVVWPWAFSVVRNLFV